MTSRLVALAFALLLMDACVALSVKVRFSHTLFPGCLYEEELAHFPGRPAARTVWTTPTATSRSSRASFKRLALGACTSSLRSFS